MTYKTQIKVQFDALTTTVENGGSEVLGYDLVRDDGENGDFESLVSNKESYLGLQFTDYLVTPGKHYRYKYRAMNVNGWGDFSDIGYLYAASVPDTPAAPSLILVDAT